MYTPFVVSCVLVLAVSASAVAGVVPPGTVAVVTTDGFFVPDPASATPLVFAPAVMFGGVASLGHPAVEWERGTDSFLVASGASLHRVEILALQPAVVQVTDLTPAAASPLDIFDLDQRAGGNDLFLLDQSADVVLRFAPPFAAGMTPVATIPVAASVRAIAVDSRSHPNAIEVAELNRILRIELPPGSGSDLVADINFPVGLDHDPRLGGEQGTFLVVKGSNTVGRATSSPNLIVSMNYLGFCTPLALAPVDVEWDPISNRAFVLAEDGLNGGGACFASGIPAVGKNHVVRFPVAQGPVVPTLYTFPGGSGITGAGGDLAIAHADFGFLAPYGAGCDPFGAPPSLDVPLGAITTASPTLTLVHVGAPPSAPVWLVAGIAQMNLALPLGCSLLASPDVAIPIGIADANGALTVSFALPPLPVGLEIFLQTLAPHGGGLGMSEGLRLHLGI